MRNIKGGISENKPIRWFGCSIEQQPNNLIMGDLVVMAEQPKQPNNLISSLSSINHKTHTLDVFTIGCCANLKNNFMAERQKLLDNLKNKQPFLVWTGKKTDKWENYEKFKPEYCLRQILEDEVIIEFDHEDKNLTWEAVNFTAINLYEAGYPFEIWDHGGRSPHLHVNNLNILHFEPAKRTAFKRWFIRKFVPVQYHKWADFSLAENKRLIALELSPHWKGCYSIKRLINKWEVKQ